MTATPARPPRAEPSEGPLRPSRPYRAAATGPASSEAERLAPHERPPLTRILAEHAVATPDASALGEGDGWSCAATLAEVDRMAARLRRLKLPPGSPVGVIWPAGPLATVALLAIESAHLLPCLVPAYLSEEATEAALALVNAQAVVAATSFGDLRPTELACAVAGRLFGLRFVLSSGPVLPDGVVDLGPVPGEPAVPGHRLAPTRSGVVTLDMDAMPPTRRRHVASSLIDAAASIVAAAGIREGDTVLSGLAIDDLPGLCAGPIAALLAGATLDTSLVARPELLAQVRPQDGLHLVLPAWAARLRARLPDCPRSGSVIATDDGSRPEDGFGVATVLLAHDEGKLAARPAPMSLRPGQH